MCCSRVEITNCIACEYKLQVNFVSILKEYDYEDLILGGDNIKTLIMTLLNIQDPYRTKLAYEWDDFCESSQFKSGDKILFRLDVTSLTKKCHVYKLSLV